MKVLVTGATGFVGAAALRTLEARGHQVTLVVRSESDARRFEARGHTARVIELTDLATLRDTAQGVHAVIHCAASDNPDFWPVSERAALAMIDGLPDGAAFASHGGTMLFGATGVTPATPEGFAPPPPLAQRAAVDVAVERAASDRLKTVLAYGAFVYGGDGAALPHVMKTTARRMAAACYPGKGTGLWSSVHVDDFGALLVDGVANAGMGHHRVVASANAVTIKEAAEATAKALSLPVRSLNKDETEHAFGIFAGALEGNQYFSDIPARTLCGWQPTMSSMQSFEASFTPG